MPGYWHAHSDRDWQLPICPTFSKSETVEGACVIQAPSRRELLRQAADLIERAERHERWGCSAQDYAAQAAGMLRRAGLSDLAADCEDEFGIDAAALLKDIDAECRR